MALPEQHTDPRQTSAWQALSEHATQVNSLQPHDLLADRNLCFEQFSMRSGALLADFSRAKATPETLALLVQLAQQRDLQAWSDALFAGEYVNSTEGRAALHTSLRADQEAQLDGDEVAAAVAAEKESFLNFADAVRSGARTSSTGEPFRTVINIGIGGSDLGPRFVSQALRDADDTDGPDVRFVASLDGMELRSALRDAECATTLFIICSKTFSTLETLTNARAARSWLLETLSEAQAQRHFAAVSVNSAAMDAFGVASDARFTMWDWVGGRYSVWSPVGVSAAIALGRKAFNDLLAGAAAMDRHFRDADWANNLPVMHGLLAVWNRSFLGLDQHVVLPYDHRLVGLPDYLQQLWMESLGKSVRRDGSRATVSTGAALWGNGGSCAQHSFGQWLHQGHSTASVEYLAAVNGADGRDADAHLQSLANTVAQAEVPAYGSALVDNQDSGELHQVLPGGRPATLLLLDELSAGNLGSLLAFYEHSVYVQSVIWGINPFDQYGVEQSKVVARQYSLDLLAGERDGLPPIGARIIERRK